MVPDWAVLALLGLWGVSALLAPWALGTTPLAGLACGCAGLGAGFAFHALGWLGGGDGKLLAAVALWLGPADVGFGLLAARGAAAACDVRGRAATARRQPAGRYSLRLRARAARSDPAGRPRHRGADLTTVAAAR